MGRSRPEADRCRQSPTSAAAIKAGYSSGSIQMVETIHGGAAVRRVDARTALAMHHDRWRRRECVCAGNGPGASWRHECVQSTGRVEQQVEVFVRGPARGAEDEQPLALVARWHPLSQNAGPGHRAGRVSSGLKAVPGRSRNTTPLSAQCSCNRSAIACETNRLSSARRPIERSTARRVRPAHGRDQVVTRASPTSGCASRRRARPSAVVRRGPRHGKVGIPGGFWTKIRLRPSHLTRAGGQGATQTRGPSASATTCSGHEKRAGTLGVDRVPEEVHPYAGDIWLRLRAGVPHQK